MAVRTEQAQGGSEGGQGDSSILPWRSGLASLTAVMFCAPQNVVMWRRRREVIPHICKYLEFVGMKCYSRPIPDTRLTLTVVPDPPRPPSCFRGQERQCPEKVKAVYLSTYTILNCWDTRAADHTLRLVSDTYGMYGHRQSSFRKPRCSQLAKIGGRAFQVNGRGSQKLANGG